MSTPAKFHLNLAVEVRAKNRDDAIALAQQHVKRLGNDYKIDGWIIKGAIITEVNFGDYNYDDDGTPVNIQVTVQPDYCILNY